MEERVTLDAEFLRRALGQGREDAAVVVTPGALPPDLPVTLPELVGVRVLGGVRLAEVRWSSAPESQPRRLTHWRVFLDVPGPQPGVMRALTADLEGQGWQVGQTWRQAFVEATAQQWMGVHAGQERTLTLQARGEDRMTQVWLDVQDIPPEQVRHMLGQGAHDHLHRLHELPLPTLTAPEGWRVRVLGGGGGETERSERVILLPPQQGTQRPDLLAHFTPQLERQGWSVLHVGDEAGAVYLTARTGQGVGVLTLWPDAAAWQAVLLQVALRPGGTGGYSSVSSYILSS